MKDIYYIIGTLILLILVIIYMSRKIEDVLLSGFWSANSSFCQDADLQWFILYLGDDIGYINHKRNGYICAANEEGIIINNSATISFSSSLSLSVGLSNCNIYNITIDWDEDSLEIDEFPSQLQLAYYPKYGKIVLYKDDIVKAILWKDLQTSSVTSSQELMPKNIEKNVDGLDIDEVDINDRDIVDSKNCNKTVKYDDL